MGRGKANQALVVRRLGLCDYSDVLERMREHVRARPDDDADELWLLQHHAVITTGVRAAALPWPRANPAGIPIIASDRGGLATAHNPGQAVAYCLWRLARLGLSAPQLVRRLEAATVTALADYGIDGRGIKGQPGVYVKGRKIASVGLRIRQGWCYHGLSVNVHNRLDIFEGFEPCGIEGLELVSLQSLGVETSVDGFLHSLAKAIATEFGYTLTE